MSDVQPTINQNNLLNNYQLGSGGLPTPPVQQLPILDPTQIVTTALEQLSSAQTGYQRLYNYYDGRHSLAFATDKFRNAFGRLFRAFADNLCPTIIDAVADRLEITGFEPEYEQGAGVDSQVQDDVEGIWRTNLMDLVAGEVHKEALKAGDAYVIVWPDVNGVPRIHFNDAALVTVSYSDEQPDVINWAVKAWMTSGDLVRLNLYTPTMIAKYISKHKRQGQLPTKFSEFEIYEVPGEEWPLPNPFGQVPVFHFANNTIPGKFGWSELSTVIPLQDALNKAISDMLVAMEFVALPQRYITGMAVDVDEDTGLPKPAFQPGVERIWAIQDENAKFGEFKAADITQFLEVQREFRQEMARVSGTPLHYIMLSNNPPSGEALKALDARMVKKVEDRQTAFGNIWQKVMLFALQVQRNSVEPVGFELECKWVAPGHVTQQEEITTQFGKQQLGVDRKTSLMELGYPEAKVDEMLALSQVPPITSGSSYLLPAMSGHPAAHLPGMPIAAPAPTQTGGATGGGQSAQGPMPTVPPGQ